MPRIEGGTELSYRRLLDALPLPVFIVDEDVRIMDYNRAAGAAFGLQLETVLTRRGGEVMHCLHAQDVPQGCGRGPACRNCVIRSSVGETFRGGSVSRRRMKAQLATKEGLKQLELLVTTSPYPGAEPMVLLILEDISEITTLREIVPICAKCKKIRDDEQFWEHVEVYFHNFMGVDFSHGLCPTCMKDLFGRSM